MNKFIHYIKIKKVSTEKENSSEEDKHGVTRVEEIKEEEHLEETSTTI